MNDMLLKLYVKFQELKNREEGQDLVEYALVVALIAFGATAGMTSLATGINTAFSNVSSQLGRPARGGDGAARDVEKPSGIRQLTGPLSRFAIGRRR